MNSEKNRFLESLQLPVIFVRDVLVYPKTKKNITLKKLSSKMAIEVAMEFNLPVIIAIMQPLSREKIDFDNFKQAQAQVHDIIAKKFIFEIATLAKVHNYEMADGNISCIAYLEGIEKVKLEQITCIPNFEQAVKLYGTPNKIRKMPSSDRHLFTATSKLHIEKLDPLITKFIAENKDDEIDLVEKQELIKKTIRKNFIIVAKKYLSLVLTEDEFKEIANSNDPFKLKLIVVNYLYNNKKIEQAYKIYATEETSSYKQLILACNEKLRYIEIDKKIEKEFNVELSKNSRNYHLQEKLKVIQKQISELNGYDFFQELDDFEKKIKKLKLKKNIEQKITAEVQKLRSIPASSSEAGVSRAYLNQILKLPWNNNKKLHTDINKTRKILDLSHYGLLDVKQRILEYLSVLARINQKNKSKTLELPQGAVLCLIGPPGVGKTSLAKSIAKALGREFLQISLGGMHDEGEIRGHRRTYLGSMPGKIIKAMQNSKYNNPLILLDEIDKIGHKSQNGDPSAALLELLDPEQNANFTDNYLDVPYDLSKVLFITTANSLNISSPLMDRLEIINLSGYTYNEKFDIALKYLLPEQMKNHLLSKKDIRLERPTLKIIIDGYTKEAGVRELSRQIEKILRKVVFNFSKITNTKEASKTIVINNKNLTDYLGETKYNYDKVKAPQIGQVTGLAWNQLGGDTLNIEVIAIPKSQNKIQFTGKLGQVMQESAQTALSLIRQILCNLEFNTKLLKDMYLHIHVPDGATPKDGPSAGIALSLAIFSAITQTKIKPKLAMTGEITLKGNVLAVGGLKEKLLAAKRSGITTVLLPKSNDKNVHEFSDDIVNGITIIYVETFQEVLAASIIDYKKLTLKQNKTKFLEYEKYHEDIINIH